MTADNQTLTNAITNNANLNKIAAQGGSVWLGTAANTGLNLSAIYVREDTTITVITGLDPSGAAYNFITPLGISGKTLMQGDFFPVPNGYRITAITLTGSIIGYM